MDSVNPPYQGEETAVTALYAPIRSPGPVRRQRRGPTSPTEGAEKLVNGEGTSQTPPLEPLPPPYLNRGELGRGGMGVVYRAYEPPAEREVAIKFLPPSSNNKDQTRRFQREAQELKGLSHPNIVAFHTSGSYRGRDYLVMELVDGENLSTTLQERSEPMPLLEICALFAPIADGLAHIHEKGVVHRDLKPANILIAADGTPKISDFGLARSLEDRSQLTSTGAIVGTISYLSPEQIVSSSVGPAADLYSLGACLYEAVIGRPPFTADTEFGMLNKHLKETPVLPSSLRPEVPPELDNLVMRMLKKAPADRPQSSEEVARQLRSLRTRLSTSAGGAGGLVGREALLKQLKSLLGLVQRGEGVACLLNAPHGLGRSSLVRELFGRLKQAGLQPLLVTPEFSSRMQLRDLYVHLGGAAERFNQRLAAAGPMGAMLLLQEALASSGKPTLLIADDVARLPETLREQLKCLARLEPMPNTGWLISTTLQLEIHPSCQHVELSPLSDDNLLQLAQLRLKHPLAPEFARELLARAAGSARQLALSLLALQGERALKLDGDNLRTDHWPEDETNAVLVDFAQGEEADLKLLRAAALIGQLFPFSVARLAAGLSESEAESSLARLLASGVWEEVWNHQDEHYCFASEAIRLGLQGSAAERGRKRLHTRLAGIFEERGELAAAGLHLLLAGQEAEALPQLLAGAQRATAEADYAGAVDCWQLADGLSSDPAVIWQIWAGLAESLWSAHRPAAIRELLEPRLASAPLEQRDSAARVAAVVARARPAGERAELCRSWMPVSPELCIPLAEALELESRYTEALDALQCSGRPASYWPVAGRMLAALGRREEARALFRQGVDKMEQLGLAETYRLWAELARLVEPVESALLLNRAGELANRVGDRDQQVFVLLEESRLGDTEELLGQAVELSRPNGPRLAEACLRLGEWLQAQQNPGAETSLREALTLSPTPGDPTWARTRGSLSALLASSGRASQADELLLPLESQPRWGVCAAALRKVLTRSDQLPLLAELPSDRLPAGSYEEAVIVSARAMLGQSGERQRALQLLPNAPSQIYGDPLQAWRGWLLQQLETVPATTVLFEAPPPRVSGRGPGRGLALGLVAAGLAVIGVGASWPMWHRPAETPTPIAIATPTASTTPSTAPSATLSATPTPTPSLTPTVLSPAEEAASIAARAEHQALAPPPTVTATGQLSVVLKAVPVKLSLDGRDNRVQSSPFDTRLAPGKHKLEVSRAGYKSFHLEVEVKAGEKFQTEPIGLDPEVAVLVVRTAQLGAQVWVDGVERGLSTQAPLRVTGLSPGFHELKVALNGYVPVSQPLELKPGQTINRSLRLLHIAQPVRHFSAPPRPYSPPRPSSPHRAPAGMAPPINM